MPKPPDWRSKVDPAQLATLPPFAGIDAPGLADIAAVAQPRRIARNETLFEQGAPANGYFLLLDGRLKIVQVTEDGQQIVVRFVGPGEPAGALAALGIPAYPASAIAVADSVALAWNAEEAGRLMQRFPGWAMSTSRAVGGRIQEAHTRIREISTERVERRIAHAILRLARQAGKPVEEGGLQIEFPLSRQDIAEMTGTTLHTVSRTLSAWEEAGYVEGGRQRIVIKDPRALRQIAEES
jgi:CRP-like cAMP-binding protein